MYSNVSQSQIDKKFDEFRLKFLGNDDIDSYLKNPYAISKYIELIVEGLDMYWRFSKEADHIE